LIHLDLAADGARQGLLQPWSQCQTEPHWPCVCESFVS